MIKINLVFGGDLSDVDIILIPESIYEDIENIAQKFLYWISDKSNDHGYWRKTSKGIDYAECETEGFVNWLNEFCCKDESKATILKSHIKFVPKYKTIDF